MSSLHLLSIFYLVNVMVEVEAIKMFTEEFYKLVQFGKKKKKIVSFISNNVIA
jgi:hypothetical protein